MVSLMGELEALTVKAIEMVTGVGDAPPMLAATKDEKRGDYQCNAAMGLAKKLGRKPRELASLLQAKMLELDGGELLESIEVAGPGFLNLKILDRAILSHAQQVGQAKESKPVRVVVDYSCPNVAKQMHVGHLRSTIIGDAISRILTHMGYEVIRQNHIGDWGTQFGLLCAWIMDRGSGQLDENIDLSDLESLYRQSQALANEDEDFKIKSRARVVALHNGDRETLAVWRQIVEKSLGHIEQIYRRLNVLLTREDIRGESFYNPHLLETVEDLAHRFMPKANETREVGANGHYMEVVKDQGATCIFIYDQDGTPVYLTAQEQPQPLLIRKADGAFLYPTTDLAAMQFRVQELKANWLIYVTDARQVLHFKMMFEASLLSGYAQDSKLEHITFGSVLGPDNKPLKTRSGENVKLADLLEEAVEKASHVIENEDKEGKARFSEEEIHEISETVGIGAVKYADLSQNRSSDYVFSFDKMMAMEGNTAPYLMYAYARIRSIERKAQAQTCAGEIILTHPNERRLAMHLARFDELLEVVMSGWRINLLCEYLYSLAGLYMKFYETCPVLNAPEAGIRSSRLAIGQRTAFILRTGLDLLGIKVLERM